jgi:hypothetical protein
MPLFVRFSEGFGMLTPSLNCHVRVIESDASALFLVLNYGDELLSLRR